jgi:ribosomal protein L11 methyltransferase
MPLWPDLTLTALFAAPLPPERVAALLGPLAGARHTVASVDEAALAQATREPIRPLRIGPRLAIVPAEEFDPGDETALGLHMGLAFGTGQHATTRLCLQWLEREAAGGATVLDFGCGTGVLALAALKLGARQATAIDNEAQALAATRRNAALNGLDDRLTIGLPEPLPAGPFDLILANVLAGPLNELAEAFAARQAAGGRIVLSGILASQLDAVVRQYRPWYDALQIAELEKWTLLSGTRRKYDR